MSSVDEVWEDLFQRYGDALRVVTRFQAGTFETRMRPDVRDLYTEYEDRRVVDEVVLNQLLSERIEREFKCGTLTGTVHILDDILIAVQASPDTRKSGYLATFDRGDGMDVGDLDDCFEYLRTQAA